MQGWMIALIVVAGVVLLLALTLLVGALVAFRKILGRRKIGSMKNEFPEKYAVDISWFDTVKDFTETLEISSYDGLTLRAKLLKHNDTDGDGSAPRRVAVLQHGYCSTPRSMQPYAKIFFDSGYDVLLPAARAHDISDGNAVGMAWLDRFDILRWLDKVVALYGEKVKIALMGVSMGGSTVIAAAGMNLPPQVKCVVDDCGFSSQFDEYSACIHIGIPKKLALLPLAIGVRLKCGYSIYDADITELARKMSVPTLFIHGDADAFVPVELGRKLFDACASAEKSMLVIEGAPHAASYATDKEKYTNALTEFVSKHM